MCTFTNKYSTRNAIIQFCELKHFFSRLFLINSVHSTETGIAAKVAGAVAGMMATLGMMATGKQKNQLRFSIDIILYY